MTEKLKQKMSEEITKLSKEKQEAINSIDWGKKTEEIGKKFTLTDTEINDLQLETGLVLIGLFDFDLFILNIENEVGLTTQQATSIANEILNNILSPISDKIISSIKNNTQISNVSWDKTVNFIVSGGDYSVFL
jgi:hypothetical protein